MNKNNYIMIRNNFFTVNTVYLYTLLKDIVLYNLYFINIKIEKFN